MVCTSTKVDTVMVLYVCVFVTLLHTMPSHLVPIIPVFFRSTIPAAVQPVHRARTRTGWRADSLTEGEPKRSGVEMWKTCSIEGV